MSVAVLPGSGREPSGIAGVAGAGGGSEGGLLAKLADTRRLSGFRVRGKGGFGVTAARGASCAWPCLPGSGGSHPALPGELPGGRRHEVCPVLPGSRDDGKGGPWLDCGFVATAPKAGAFCGGFG
ncbi:hypothetical protein [Thalassospira sp.]|uniref:hypothetical protein n=1 Tax=Thalassospira sp. TaxID=1912094 RepID=UPI0027352206|nr:hypothetical protein [Thalassospira sp.]MDP2698092.1 hypothetical protein [Thalassospira sp.]